jgi:integrase/recombinase XerD
MMVARRALKAGIAKRVHPHGLRHYYAASLDRDGYPLAQISTLLGHSSTVQSAVYLERLRGVDRLTAERLREREWAT